MRDWTPSIKHLRSLAPGTKVKGYELPCEDDQGWPEPKEFVAIETKRGIYFQQTNHPEKPTWSATEIMRWCDEGYAVIGGDER